MHWKPPIRSLIHVRCRRHECLCPLTAHRDTPKIYPCPNGIIEQQTKQANGNHRNPLARFYGYCQTVYSSLPQEYELAPQCLYAIILSTLCDLREGLLCSCASYPAITIPDPSISLSPMPSDRKKSAPERPGFSPKAASTPAYPPWS